MKKLLLILLFLPMIGFGQDDDVKIIDTLYVENMPEFPGGDVALMKYIKENINYPEICKKEHITGKVYVQFIVNKSGSVSNVKIVRGVDKNLDAEAVRVVESLPKYKPARQRGEPVSVMFTIPITFALKKKWWKRLWINDDRYYY